MTRAAALQAFLHRAGWADAERRPLAGDASFRRYDRLHRGGETAVLMDAPPPQEDVRPFVQVARLLGRHGVSPSRVVKVGSAGETISKLASSGKFDLVVMGSHGHGALANLVMGSVATQVLAHCRVPVLLVR